MREYNKERNEGEGEEDQLVNFFNRGMEKNQFYGSLPSSFYTLVNMTNLWLWGNNMGNFFSCPSLPLPLRPTNPVPCTPPFYPPSLVLFPSLSSVLLLLPPSSFSRWNY
jgi:hypothetical protein